ncbi:UNVERIFIED_ORG: hypothetical protein E4P37_05295 [Bacillus sp. AZ43]
MRPPGPEAGTEVQRAQEGTWMALVLVPVGIVVLLFLDGDLNPVVHGLFGVIAALELMIAARWWRKRRRAPR